MIKLPGIKTSALPYGELILVDELMNFDENPMLLHFSTESGTDVLAYWVDFAEGKVRWLYNSISKTELYLYLSGRNSLKATYENISAEYIFIVEILNNSGDHENIQMFASTNIPDQYIPGENSFYREGLSDFYQDYLFEIDYDQNLKDRSYVITGKPADLKHKTYLTAKEGSKLLLNMTNSAESYVAVISKQLYKEKIGSQNKLNKIAGQFKTALTPIITQAVIHSFEVWLTMDTIILNDVDEVGKQIKADVLDGYKRDVLDVDFTSTEDAQIICEKFDAVERKAIYGPIIDLLENENINVTISDRMKTIRETGRPVKTNEGFKDLILPPKTLDELIAEKEKKSRIFTLVVSLKEGTDVTSLTKKQLMDNLLSTASDDETSFPIKSPIEIDGTKIILKKPIEAVLKITEDENLEISSQVFDLYSKGQDIQKMKDTIYRQFLELIDLYASKKKGDKKTIDLLSEYIDLPK